MKDHIRVLVCGDEQVGKSSFISTVIARHFPDRVPHILADVHIPPEENDDDVNCTISDSSALPRDRPQLLANLKIAESIVLMYDVERLETLSHLDTFWLPLIEANTENVPVVIVRNKVDKIVADPTGGERSDEDLRRQMAPLKERYKFFHTSLECSSISQVGLTQVFHHALTAALYPVAPLYDSKADQLCPLFDRAIRRLFRIYDRDGDGLLGDHELNSFQYESFRLNLSDEDIAVLKHILTKVAADRTPESSPPVLVVPAAVDTAGGVTTEGFVRLMRIFIDKKQMKAPWKALYSHNYDERLNLLVPPECMDPPPGPMGGGWHDQALSSKAEAFVLSLFEQFSSVVEGSAERKRILTPEDQRKIFSVIPDPACAPWDSPRSEEEFEWQDGDYELFGRLRRAPGAGDALTAEGWMAHWQMLAAHSPLLARVHLFYSGFREDVGDMLVTAQGRERGKRRPQGREQRRVMQVYLLGRSGCGRGRLVKALRLGEDLRSRKANSAAESMDAVEEVEPEVPETCAAFSCTPHSDTTGGSSPGSSDASDTAECVASSRFQPVTVTEVPEAFTDAFVQEQAWRCELAVLVFDPASWESLDYVTRTQGALPEGVSRIVVACVKSSGQEKSSVLKSAREMCKELELSPPVVAFPERGDGLEGDGGLRERITHTDGPGVVPHGEQHRRRKDRNRKIRTATVVTLTLMGAAVAIAAFYKYKLPTDGSSTRSAGAGGDGGMNHGWKAGVGGAFQAPVRAAKRAAAVAVDFWRRLRSPVTANNSARGSPPGESGAWQEAHLRQTSGLYADLAGRVGWWSGSTV